MGIIMFLIGTSMFTYTGDLNPIISEIGKYSFFGWLATIFIGVILFAIKKSDPCSHAIISSGETVIGIYISAKRYNRAPAKVRIYTCYGRCPKKIAKLKD